jgi:hypothetical protein
MMAFYRESHQNHWEKSFSLLHQVPLKFPHYYLYILIKSLLTSNTTSRSTLKFMEWNTNQHIYQSSEMSIFIYYHFYLIYYMYYQRQRETNLAGSFHSFHSIGEWPQNKHRSSHPHQLGTPRSLELGKQKISRDGQFIIFGVYIHSKVEQMNSTNTQKKTKYKIND